MQRSLPLAYQEGSNYSFTCNALTVSSRGAQKHVFFTLLFPSADSFRTCHVHHGYCPLLPRLPLTWQGLQQGSNRPAERVWGGVKEPQRWRPTALMSCCWTAGPSNCSIITCRKDRSARSEKERGWGLVVEVLLKQEWENPAVLGSEGAQRKAVEKLVLFGCSSEPLCSLSGRTLGLQYVSNDL